MNTSSEHGPWSSEVLARTGQAHGSEARVYPRVVSECSVVWCPSVYPEVVSECSVVWCPSVGCTDLRARGVRVSRAGSLVNAVLDLVPGGVCISFIRVSASPR